MKIGYARVSTNTQDLDLQIQELKKAGCVKIFSESMSGKDNNRTELLNMLNELREKDVVVVYKIDRIARSLKGLIEIVELLKNKIVLGSPTAASKKSFEFPNSPNLKYSRSPEPGYESFYDNLLHSKTQGNLGGLLRNTHLSP